MNFDELSIDEQDSALSTFHAYQELRKREDLEEELTVRQKKILLKNEKIYHFISKVTQDSAGFEMVSKIQLPQRPEIPRGPALTAEEWKKFIDAEGRVVDARSVRMRVFRGVSQEKLFLKFHEIS